MSDFNFLDAISNLTGKNYAELNAKADEETKDKTVKLSPYSQNGAGKGQEVNGVVKKNILDSAAVEENLIDTQIVDDDKVSTYKGDGFFTGGMWQRIVQVFEPIKGAVSSVFSQQSINENEEFPLYGAYYDTASRQNNISPKNDTLKLTNNPTFESVISQNYGISKDDPRFNAIAGQILEANRDDVRLNSKQASASINSVFNSASQVEKLSLPDDTKVTIDGENITFGELKANTAKYFRNDIENNKSVTFDVSNITDIDLSQFKDENGGITLDNKHFDDVSDVNLSMLKYQDGSVTLNGVTYETVSDIDYSALKDVGLKTLFQADEIELPTISSEFGYLNLIDETNKTTQTYTANADSASIDVENSLEDVIAAAYGVQKGTIGFNYLLNQVVESPLNDGLFKSTGTERLEDALSMSTNGDLVGKTVNFPKQSLVLDVYGADATDGVSNDDVPYFSVLKGNQNIAGSQIEELNQKVQTNIGGMVNTGVISNALLSSNNGAKALFEQFVEKYGEGAVSQENLLNWTNETMQNADDDTIHRLNTIVQEYNAAYEDSANKTVMNTLLSQYFGPQSTRTLDSKNTNGEYTYQNLVSVVKKAIISSNSNLFNDDGTLKQAYIGNLDYVKEINIPNVIYNLNEDPIIESSGGGGGGPTPDPGCNPAPSVPTDND